MRNTILQCGGEVHFQTKMVSFLLRKLFTLSGTPSYDDGTLNEVAGVKAIETTSNGEHIEREYHGPVILATGHSARDVYRYLADAGIFLEAKALAVGVRLEHPAQLIDQIQYHNKEGRGDYLTAAEYNFVTQVEGRGVQEELERVCWQQGNRKQTAPAQRMADFVNGKLSADLPESSYAPGLIASPLHFWMPEIIASRLRQGFRKFGAMSHGFLTNNATVIAVETRTSSPVRILRDKDTLEHVNVKGLFPCGEGAGYAGGIVSAGVDGERCAEQVARLLGVL